MDSMELMGILNSDAGGLFLVALVVAVLVILVAVFLKAANEVA